jgi:hypothetical protein
MGSFHQPCEFVGGHQCHVPRALPPDEHHLTIIDDFVEHSREVFAQMRIARFPHTFHCTGCLYGRTVLTGNPDCNPNVKCPGNSTNDYFSPVASTVSKYGASVSR